MDFHRIKSVLQTEHTLQDHEWKGAVVFLCNEESVFLIKRSDLMPSHGGQMAFIGGHKKIDETDPWIVAQREYEEETSLKTDDLEFLGYLPVVLTARLQAIVPVMVRLKISTDDFLSSAKSNGEWDLIMAYPWANLMIEDRWEFAWRSGYSQSPILFYPIEEGGHLLWGATAGMIWDFMRLYFRS